MIFLIHHIRKIVLITNILIALVIYFLITSNFSGSLVYVRLAQTFAFAAVLNLYLALIASPLYSAFAGLKIKPIHIRSRRALGQSTFLFATLHAYFAFFKLLGGFSGLAFLGSKYIIPIIFSSTALLILSLMTATSFDYMVRKLGPQWKTLHRFVYLASFLILIHALMLGTHFINLSTLIPKIFFVALAILLILEALRFDKYLRTKFAWLPNFGTSLVIVLGIIIWVSFYLRAPSETATTSLGIHAQHIELAKQAQNSNSSLTNLPNLPGLDGDRTKRYTMTFNHPDVINPKQNVKLSFQMFDASNGNQISLFKRPYQEVFHLIIADSQLEYFTHIHPEQNGGQFSITTSFPRSGTYRLYTDAQPVGGIDQQMAFTLKVGNGSNQQASQQIDDNLTKTFGKYEVSLDTRGPLSAKKMSLGEQKLTFTIKDSATKSPVTDLKPYLNSFGHLVMIKQDTYEYLHVHPYNLTAPAANENGGPNVEFLPIGIYGPFKAGSYRVFGQFNHAGKLFVADFTAQVGN